MRLKQNLWITAMLFAAIVSAASFLAGKSNPQGTKKLYQRSGNDGTVTGIVSFAGLRPAEHLIDMSADPECRIDNRGPKTEMIVGNEGRLANVFVYIKSGAALDDLSFETPATPVLIDQKRCRFVPHVVGVQTNQIVEIANSDPTTHNVHPQPFINAEWNQSYISGSPPMRKQFSRPEVMIPIKCNQHPWMLMYLGVVSHPFFSVSDQNGTFRIEGLPRGSYTIAAWHEKLGEKTMEVSVPGYSQQQLDFTFKAGDTW
jgi:hypothetical protein